LARNLRERLNEALISLVKLYNRHAISVLRGFAHLPGRKRRCEEEVSLPMLRRWRERRRLLELARLLAQLDAYAETR
jgi:hypothetical protein